MEDTKTIVPTMVTKTRKSHKFRDTVPVRVDRKIREELKAESARTHETMSKIVDWALREYMDSVK